ncbi:MAG TPA: quinol:electron acceptor oxidoreductase subunit ActD [Candidatus Binatia bacterium]|jgi:mono/diheme cytochrome c family protein
MSERVFAVVGLFDSADDLLKAIPRLRARAIGSLEAYTPFPVHGIDAALGLRRSPLGGMVLVAGALGAVTALFFQWWMSAVDYPIPVGGKALFSWQAFVPIMFEITVLFATFTAGLGMLLLMNKLPFFGHPLLSSKAIAGITRDKFALAVEADGGALDVDAAQAALRTAGATVLEVLPYPLGEAFSLKDLFRTVLGIGISCVVAGYVMYWAIKLFPVLPPMVHMEDQPRLDVQKADTFFRDGHGMQRPVEGTVARGHLPYIIETQEQAAALINPLPRTPKVLQQGRKAWNEHCTVCHGALGNGVPTLTSAYGAKPANLQAQTFRDYPDGKIYHVIMVGKNAMPSYAADLTEDERWAVVHYVRVLQRAQNATDEDFK